MKNLFGCVDTLFKGYDYNNIRIKKSILKIHNNEENAWISIDTNIYSIRKDDKLLLKLFKDFYGKNVKDFILHDNIFNLITLNDNYAPNDIYNNIINLKFNNEASSFITIETDLIKKKIIIYLFFNYIILSTIHLLLIENFKINIDIFYSPINRYFLTKKLYLDITYSTI